MSDSPDALSSDDWVAPDSAFSDYRAGELEQLYESSMEGRKIRTPLALSEFREHQRKLSSVAGKSRAGLKYDGYDIEFNYIEYNSEIAVDQLNACLAEYNVAKNRYPSIVSPDPTRVRLQRQRPLPADYDPEEDADEEESEDPEDYINANFMGLVRRGQSPTRYCVAQGALSSTIADFWRMIWEQQISVMVMLTLEEEGGRAKCACYWPDGDEDTAERFGDFLVELVDVEMEDSFFKRTMTVTRVAGGGAEEAGGATRELTHFQFVDWPDHGCPKERSGFLDLVEAVQRAEQAAQSHDKLGVHCSAGVGRSGTFIVVHALLELAQRNGGSDGTGAQFDLVDAVVQLRDCRPGMVQTKFQFKFCYQAIDEALVRRGWLEKLPDSVASPSAGGAGVRRGIRRASRRKGTASGSSRRSSAVSSPAGSVKPASLVEALLRSHDSTVQAPLGTEPLHEQGRLTGSDMWESVLRLPLKADAAERFAEFLDEQVSAEFPSGFTLRRFRARTGEQWGDLHVTHASSDMARPRSILSTFHSLFHAEQEGDPYAGNGTASIQTRNVFVLSNASQKSTLRSTLSLCSSGGHLDDCRLRLHVFALLQRKNAAGETEQMSEGECREKLASLSSSEENQWLLAKLSVCYGQMKTKKGTIRRLPFSALFIIDLDARVDFDKLLGVGEQLREMLQQSNPLLQLCFLTKENRDLLLSPR